jgi:hypothetical protein
MNTPTNITADQLDRISERIRDAPPPAMPLTVVDAVRQLAPTIAKMRKSGHTLDSVAVLLQSEGLQVTARSLSRMLRQSGGKRRVPTTTK